MSATAAGRRNVRHNVPGRRELILHLRNQGMTERGIAEALRISKTTVHHYLNYSGDRPWDRLPEPETENEQ